MVAKPRILVVDDEPVVRESIYEWFSQDEYPIEMAASGPEAMQKMQESSWDILLTDVKMPGMDGLELQQKAKGLDPDITVIIMTAYASVDSAMQAIKEGAYDYVTKPLDPEDLQQIVNRAAERRQLVRENLELKQRIEAVRGETERKLRPGVVNRAAERRQLVRENLELKQRIEAVRGETERKLRPGELSLAEVEKQHIQNVLVEVSGDLSRAAHALEIDEATLNDMLRRHGLEGSQA
jgi:DNA-binding NtrC family response regulator